MRESGSCSPFGLTGKVALVTGSSRGLGLVLARGLARAGASVALNGRNQEQLTAAVEQLTGEGLPARGFVFDVADGTGVGAGVEAIQRELGPIDVLVNNAGVNLRGPLETIEDETWHEVIRTNLTGPFVVTRAVVRGMIERKRGKIIHMCSVMSDLGRTTTGPYAASKGGLKMLTRAMAVEWARHNIQVNAIGPGYFLTAMTKPLSEDPAFDAWIRSRTPAGRWGDPSELIGPAVFLASDASSFVNGHLLSVDGGILAAL